MLKKLDDDGNYAKASPIEVIQNLSLDDKQITIAMKWAAMKASQYLLTISDNSLITVCLDRGDFNRLEDFLWDDQSNLA